MKYYTKSGCNVNLKIFLHSVTMKYRRYQRNQVPFLHIILLQESANLFDIWYFRKRNYKCWPENHWLVKNSIFSQKSILTSFVDIYIYIYIYIYVCMYVYSSYSYWYFGIDGTWHENNKFRDIIINCVSPFIIRFLLYITGDETRQAFFSGSFFGGRGTALW